MTEQAWYRVRLTSEQELVTDVLAPADASTRTLRGLALQQVDDGQAHFIEIHGDVEHWILNHPADQEVSDAAPE